MKFDWNLSRIRNVMLHRCFTYTLVRFMFFMTAFVTDVFLYITNIFQLDHDYFVATETAEMTKCNWYKTKMSEEQCYNVDDNLD